MQFKYVFKCRRCDKEFEGHQLIPEGQLPPLSPGMLHEHRCGKARGGLAECVGYNEYTEDGERIL